MRQKVSIGTLLILSLMASGCSMYDTGSLPETALEQGVGEYRIGPEDMLVISVWQNEDLSTTVPVRPDGMISLPLLDDVQAAGLTPEELRDTLRERLKQYISDPEVSVIVSQIHSPKISVLGNVARPARYVMSSRITVLDALALAGGLNEFASPRRITVLRPEGKAMLRLPFDYKKATAAANGEVHNFYLQPGDIVLVQ